MLNQVMKLRRITKAVALEWNTSSMAYINGEWKNYQEDFSGIDKKAAEIFIKGGQIDISGLIEISDECAEILAAHQGDRMTLGLLSLSDRAAAAFAQYRGTLDLPRLEVFSDSKEHIALASTIAEKYRTSHENTISLDNWALRQIAPQAAEILFAHGRRVGLTLKELNAGMAGALARYHTGTIHFSELATLDIDAARALAAHHGELIINNIKSVDDNVAQALSEYCGLISEIGLIAIGDSPGQLALTKKLAGGETIGLRDLATISEKAADVFAAQLNRFASLDLGLKSLADSPGQRRIAVSIANMVPNSWVRLDHLESITDEFAEALASRGGWVSLRGLTHISSKAAEALAQIKSINLSAEAKKMVSKAKKSSMRKKSARKATIAIPAGCPATVFEWLQGGVVAVKAAQRRVASFLHKEELYYDVIDAATKPWTLVNGVGLFHALPEGCDNLAKCMSARLETLAVHLYYDDCSGVVGYTIYDSGSKVEFYTDMSDCESPGEDSGFDFESRITSAKPTDLPPLEDLDDGRDCRFIDLRFKELEIRLPKEIL